MSNPVCQTTLAFHSHTQITARFDGGNLTSDADGCCLVPWIGKIDSARTSVRVLRIAGTNATFVMSS